MKNILILIALAALAPLAGCATPYGYSPGAWANYDGDYDYGYDGYDRPVSYYGQADYSAPPSGASYYAPSYYSAPAPQYPAYGAYPQPGPQPGYGGAPAYVATTYYYPTGYSTYYQGPGYGPY